MWFSGHCRVWVTMVIQLLDTRWVCWTSSITTDHTMQLWNPKIQMMLIANACRNWPLFNEPSHSLRHILCHSLEHCWTLIAWSSPTMTTTRQFWHSPHNCDTLSHFRRMNLQQYYNTIWVQVPALLSSPPEVLPMVLLLILQHILPSVKRYELPCHQSHEVRSGHVGHWDQIPRASMRGARTQITCISTWSAFTQTN